MIRQGKAVRIVLSAVALSLVFWSCSGDSTTSPRQLGSIVETAEDNSQISTLVSAIGAAGLTATLNGPGPFTVFAPTNAAFDALPPGTLDALLANPQGDLKNILLYHVVAGKVEASAVVNLTSAATVQGSAVSISVQNGAVILNGNVRVISTDIMASNGIIHLIDAVLIPPPAVEPPKTIAEIAAGNSDFSTVVTALNAAGLVSTLNGAGPFTVFAPTNAAFSALPPGTLDALLADPQGALKDVLLYHVVAGSVNAATVVTLPSAVTVQGDAIKIAVVNGEVILNDSVKVTATDIIASNGIIHVIDAVLVP